MDNVPCPKCGQQTAPETTCPGCGSTNGAAKPVRPDPPPPPKVAGWVIEQTPPELAEYFRLTFDEAEYWAAVREIEQHGGADFDACIAEIERKVNFCVAPPVLLPMDKPDPPSA